VPGEPGPHFGGELVDRARVAVRHHHVRDALPVRGHGLLLQPAHRQHAPAERDLAGHRHVAAQRHAGERAHERRGDRHAGRRPVLGRGAGREVHVHVARAVEVGVDA
jgi:hypothetical protein